MIDFSQHEIIIAVVLFSRHTFINTLFANTRTHTNSARMDLSRDMMVIRGDGRTKTSQPHGCHTHPCGTLTQGFCCLNDSYSVSFWPLEIPSYSLFLEEKERAGEAKTSKNVN